MDSMQHQLESMAPRSEAHISYVEFCQTIIAFIRARGSSIQPLSHYFSVDSLTFWSDTSDPKLYAAGIISYALRLHDQPTKTSSELFHYLYRGWRTCLVSSHLQDHIGYVQKGLKHWDFTEFMLASFMPAALHIGFTSPSGWIVPSTYLPSLAKRVAYFLDKGGNEGATAFHHMIHLLKLSINGIIVLNQRWANTRSEILAIHPLHSGIISVVCQFWLALSIDLKNYASAYPEDVNIIAYRAVTASLSTIASRVLTGFHSPEIYSSNWGIDQYPLTKPGPSVEKFAYDIKQDIERDWRNNPDWEEAAWEGRGYIDIFTPHPRPGEQRVELKGLWSTPLGEVLEKGAREFESAERVMRSSGVRAMGIF